MTREEARAYFAEIEARHAAASTGWLRGLTPAGEGMLARLIPAQEPAPVLQFDAWADRADIALIEHAHADMAFLVRLVKSLLRRLEHFEGPPSAPPKNPANPERKTQSPAENCGMYCAFPSFQQFLVEMHGLARADEESAAEHVRNKLRLASRSELNHNPAAAEGWKRLRGEYQAWRKT